MNFHTSLVFGFGLSVEIIHQKVESVLTEMGLVSCADIRIGNPNSSMRISGGERKRLTIATESISGFAFNFTWSKVYLGILNK